MYSVINAAIVGRMEKKYLAALGLGSLTTGICLISITTSFALVLGSFVAPAHGRGETAMARSYLHRQYFLNTCVWLVTLIPIIFIKQIYMAIGQEEEIADLAKQYVWIVAPCVLPYANAYAANGYAEAQKYTFAWMFTNGMATLLHIILLSIFVMWQDMGWKGVCISTSLQFLARFIFASTYITFI